MRFTSQTSSGGVFEQLFSLADIPGVLWTPESWTPESVTGTRPLILMGHGGGLHKKAPGILARARRFAAEGGFAVAAVDVPGHGDRPKDEEYDRISTRMSARVKDGEDLAPLLADFQALVARQTVPEWQAVLDALQDHLGAGPVGYWGVSLGCGLGVPFVAAEPRVRAAVLGLGGALASAEAAAGITVPVEFLVQWDDERVPRAHSLALFDAFGSAEKTLHANPGRHADRMPEFEADSSLRFFARHLACRLTSGCSRCVAAGC
ncbi:MAG: alpha/beta fold hydrolase [Streptosporangiaceae bacterium]|jgi:dienelactone hydrolase